MFGYKQIYGYFLKQVSPTPPPEPIFALNGVVASNNLTTHVAALTTVTTSGATLSGTIATMSVTTLVEEVE